jgi:hypothetical protein
VVPHRRALRGRGVSLEVRMSQSSSSGGTGIATVLLVVFVVLKLVGAIDWSWWWVLSPFWIPLCIAVFLFALAGLLSALK